MNAGERTLSAVVWFLSRDIGRAIYLQEVHVANERGECAGCRSQTNWVSHPCILRTLADETLSRLIPRPREESP